MARSADITLDGAVYKIRPFNIGELERIESASDGSGRVSFLLLEIALARAVPAVSSDEFRLLEPTSDEILAAVHAIMALSGMEQKASPPA